MNLIVTDRGRRKKKSTQLLYTSVTMNYPIVVMDSAEISYLINLARELELDDLPIPLTVKDLREHKGTFENETVLVEEGYDLINEAVNEYLGTNVVAMTLTAKIKE